MRYKPKYKIPLASRGEVEPNEVKHLQHNLRAEIERAYFRRVVFISFIVFVIIFLIAYNFGS